MTQLLPPLSAAAYQALKADIALRGVLVPVEVDAATGAVLDGHHRLQIARDLGIDAPSVERRFGSDDDRLAHVVALNLKRRHLDPVTWGEFFARYAAAKGMELDGNPGGDQSKASATVALVAKELGVPRRTAFRYLEVARLPEPLREKVRAGERSARSALLEHKRNELSRAIECEPVGVSDSNRPADSGSNGILPLEVLWPTPQYLLHGLAARYFEQASELRHLARSHHDWHGAFNLANLEDKVREVEEAISDAAEEVENAAGVHGELAEKAARHPIPWGGDPGTLLAANARQKNSRGFCAHVGCWRRAVVDGRCPFHPPGSEISPCDEAPPPEVFEPASAASPSGVRPGWSAWGLEAL